MSSRKAEVIDPRDWARVGARVLGPIEQAQGLIWRLTGGGQHATPDEATLLADLVPLARDEARARAIAGAGYAEGEPLRLTPYATTGWGENVGFEIRGGTFEVPQGDVEGVSPTRWGWASVRLHSHTCGDYILERRLEIWSDPDESAQEVRKNTNPS